MTQPAINGVTEKPLSDASSTKSNSQIWYRPTISHEHGVYVVLLVSFLTGAALAQAWTLATTLALVCAFFGFQAEHPIVLQIKQRRSLKPRFLVWGGVYSAVSLAIAFYLYLSFPILLWLYLGAVAALVVDAVSVFHREQKSIFNEFITFAAVCLCAPLAYAATTGTLSATAMGLWVLNTLYFSSTIFTVKLRKPKTSSIVPGVVYHAIATLIVATLYYLGWLPLIAALAFGLALLKFGLIALNQEWYRTAKIQWVAMLETGTAFCFLTLVALSILPAHLTRF
ncbi:YwiC-like family protein [Allocoleopsis franciscana]|nr:YwiC-like family protein [Allocoleopsis franciscana]